MTLTSSLEGRRVLLVEDEAMIAMLLEDMLGDLGCTVVGPAYALTSALALAAGESPIDVAILDINLAGRPVFEVADALRARRVRWMAARRCWASRSGLVTSPPPCIRRWTTRTRQRPLKATASPRAAMPWKHAFLRSV